MRLSHNIILLGFIAVNALGWKYSVSFPEMLLLNLVVALSYAIAKKASGEAAYKMHKSSKDLERLKLIYDDEHQDTEILHSITKISQSFTEQRDLEDVLESMISAIRSTFIIDIALIEILPNKDTPEIKLIKGISDFKLNDSIYEKVIKRGSSILINNLSPEHSEYGKYAPLAGKGIRSFLVAPLKITANPIGLIGIFARNHYDFTGAELRRLSTFATHASLIIENARLFSETQRLSITDELTQLYNFRKFKEKARDELNRAKRYGYNLSFLMCDIDSFKNYNDVNGHEVANEALKKLAGILKNSVREVDFVARYGGEEFVILLIETNKAKAVLMAERLRELVEQEYFQNQEQQPGGNFTITIGLSEFPGDGTELNEIISQADKALYEGKRTGKNKVISL